MGGASAGWPDINVEGDLRPLPRRRQALSPCRIPPGGRSWIRSHLAIAIGALVVVNSTWTTPFGNLLVVAKTQSLKPNGDEHVLQVCC